MREYENKTNNYYWKFKYITVNNSQIMPIPKIVSSEK